MIWKHFSRPKRSMSSNKGELDMNPLPLPWFEFGPAHCHRCGRMTTTVLLPLSSGHIGNCCAVCHATRKGRPFVSRAEYESWNTTNALQRAKGEACTYSRVR